MASSSMTGDVNGGDKRVAFFKKADLFADDELLEGREGEAHGGGDDADEGDGCPSQGFCGFSILR